MLPCVTQSSLFGDDPVLSWNLNKLDTILKRIDLPGVTRAMLYFGMWRAMFAFHTVRNSYPRLARLWFFISRNTNRQRSLLIFEMCRRTWTCTVSTTFTQGNQSSGTLCRPSQVRVAS